MSKANNADNKEKNEEIEHKKAILDKAGFKFYADLTPAIDYWNISMSQKEILIKIAKEEKELYETEKEPPENRGVALRAAEQYLKNAIKMKTKCSVAREAYFCFPDVSSFGFALGVVFGLNSGNTSIIVTETEEVIKAINPGLEIHPIMEIFEHE